MTELFNDENEMELPEISNCGSEITKRFATAIKRLKSWRSLGLNEI